MPEAITHSFIGYYAARHVPNKTCAVEWYCPIYGTPNVAAMIHRHATWQLQPVRMNDTPPRHVIPRERKRVEESSRVADFILWWFIIQRGGFLHSADAAVGMTILERFYGFAHCFWNVSRCTAFPHQSRPLGRASFPRGKLLYRAFGTLVFRYGVKVCTKTFPFGEGGPP